MTEPTRREVLSFAAVFAATALTRAEIVRAAWRDEKRYKTVFGQKMAYYETGSGRPIVFLHGNPTSSYLWRNIISYVRDQGRCIAPDLMGMGDSAKLPKSAYTYSSHRRHLYELLRKLGVERDIVFVLHDWGSALGFYYAQQNPAAIRGIAYMESFLVPPWLKRSQLKPRNAQLFTPRGERLILQNNIFIKAIIRDYGHFLSAAEKAEYRRPFLKPGEGRRAMLAFTRQGPFGKKETFDAMQAYTAWLMGSKQIPKLFIRAKPGKLLPSGKPIIQFASSFPNQKIVSVIGRHFIQEESPEAIGMALAEWLRGLS